MALRWSAAPLTIVAINIALRWSEEKGALIRSRPSGSVVSNMTSWWNEVYANAVLEWGEVVDLRRGEDAPLEIRWLRLTYQKTK